MYFLKSTLFIKNTLFIVLSNYKCLGLPMVLQESHFHMTHTYNPSFNWSGKVAMPVQKIQMNFVQRDDVTSRLLADITVTMVTLTAVHRQMSSGILMMSQGETSHLGY